MSSNEANSSSTAADEKLETKAHKDLLEQIGSATITATTIDSGMVVLLGALLATQPGIAGHQAAVFIYEARSFDQRLKIINGIFDTKFQSVMKKKRNENERRSLEFLKKLKGQVLSSLNNNRWVRNMAAHGSISLIDGQPKLTPGLWDFSTQKNLEKRGFKTGMTAQEIKEKVELLREDQANLVHLGFAVKQFVSYYHLTPASFLEAANRLAARLSIPELRLQDPREGPPMRQSRKKKDE